MNVILIIITRIISPRWKVPWIPVSILSLIVIQSILPLVVIYMVWLIITKVCLGVRISLISKILNRFLKCINTFTDISHSLFYCILTRCQVT